MCKKGDIILIDGYYDQGNPIDKHSFVIVQDEGGEICGLAFDFISLVMSSFKDDVQKAEKLKYPGNLEITPASKNMLPGANSKSGYIKAEQLYYFCKDKICYKVIGSMTPEAFNDLISFIEGFPAKGVRLMNITDNL